MTFQWKVLTCAANDGLPQERWGFTLTGTDINQVRPLRFVLITNSGAQCFGGNEQAVPSIIAHNVSNRKLEYYLYAY